MLTLPFYWLRRAESDLGGRFFHRCWCWCRGGRAPGLLRLRAVGFQAFHAITDFGFFFRREFFFFLRRIRCKAGGGAKRKCRCYEYCKQLVHGDSSFVDLETLASGDRESNNEGLQSELTLREKLKKRRRRNSSGAALSFKYGRLDFVSLDHFPIDLKAETRLVTQREFARFKFGFDRQHLMPERITRDAGKTLHAIPM